MEKMRLAISLDGLDQDVQGMREMQEVDNPAEEHKPLMLLNRAPSISLTSALAVRAGIWDSDCIGIAPQLIASLQGDYDGDELNV